MAGKNPFGAGLMRFLRELDANNNRDWFQENKERYEREVREPALEFIVEVEWRNGSLQRKYSVLLEPR